ncbi:hypothetical protein TNCV_1626161 [Trichonephila clavipes]|nr:hypothetical protein TNCV_1626161 [Trichonephila clavipes]
MARASITHSIDLTLVCIPSTSVIISLRITSRALPRVALAQSC